MKSKNTHAEKNNKKSTSRRNFLKKGLLAGAGTVLGAGVVGSFDAFAEGGDSIKVLGPDGKILTVDKSHLKEIGARTEAQMQTEGRTGIPGRRWIKVIDLGKCRNARMCVAACQHAHQLKPEQYHVNVLRMDREGETAPFFMPKPCQHCDDPPCTKVCPVDATFKRQDGLVLIDNERCIGCRFCIAACPYSARIFNWTEPRDAEKYKDVEYDVELNVPQKKGTVSKCLFSADLLREEKMPYCVTACPNGVYWFGDENENAVTNGTTKETVNFKKLLKDNAAYVLLPELGTKPRVYYLPEKNRLFPYKYNGSTELKKEHNS
ncbi:MAG: 4Fe-4S dicluster domain-containing protein [Chlorobi bacterium]|nr:4Fe-4S dicluster domain-containing protein [Chlorobiota bacterium]